VMHDSAGETPLWMVSLTADRLDPVAFGFAQLEQAAVGPDQLASEKAGLLAALPQAAGDPVRIVDLLLGAAP
jgi:hypothetical protein